MKWLKGAIAFGVVTGSILVAWQMIIPRYDCNRQKAIVNAAAGLASEGESIDAASLAAACRRCLETFPEDYEFHILLGKMQESLGNLDAAELSYRRSLHFNERPETYAYLGLVQLEKGNVAEARATFYHGSLFSLFVAEAVDEPLRTELMRAVMDRHRRLMNSSAIDVELSRRRQRRAKTPL
jgi:hypothetical protein